MVPFCFVPSCHDNGKSLAKKSLPKHCGQGVGMVLVTLAVRSHSTGSRACHTDTNTHTQKQTQTQIHTHRHTDTNTHTHSHPLDLHSLAEEGAHAIGSRGIRFLRVSANTITEVPIQRQAAQSVPPQTATQSHS